MVGILSPVYSVVESYRLASSRRDDDVANLAASMAKSVFSSSTATNLASSAGECRYVQMMCGRPLPCVASLRQRRRAEQVRIELEEDAVNGVTQGSTRSCATRRPRCVGVWTRRRRARWSCWARLRGSAAPCGRGRRGGRWGLQPSTWAGLWRRSNHVKTLSGFC